jgi:hypothetical protein
MQLEELKNIWQNFDESIENKLEINHQLLKEVSISKVAKLLAPIKREQIFEIVLTTLFLPILFQITFNSIQSTALMLSGSVLILILFGSIIYNLFVLKQIYGIHYEATILDAQEKLERIKVLEAREINTLYVLIPTFYLCMLVIANAFIHFKITAPVNLFWSFQMVGTLVITFIIVYFLKRFPNQSLQKALQFMGEMEDLKQDK